MCSPLGSKSRKLCAIYFSVRNISLELRSKLDFIYLVAIIECKEVKANGINCILRPVVDDLKNLENKGIEVDHQFIKCIMISFCFDNAGRNALFGLTQCFNANYYCRICKATISEVNENLTQNVSLIRTRQAYYQIFKDRNRETKELGYRFYSILNELKSVTE